MNNRWKSALSVASLLAFAAGVIATVLLLVELPNWVPDAAYVGRTQWTVGLTLVAALGALLVAFASRRTDAQVVYVERRADDT
ncbi:MAG: hypothetical protein WBA12_07960, partial [Catalinimonas sp.]